MHNIGESADFVFERLVGDALMLCGVVSFPKDGGLICSSRQMAVDAVNTGVQLATIEPASMPCGQVAFADGVPGLVP